MKHFIRLTKGKSEKNPEVTLRRSEGELFNYDCRPNGWKYSFEATVMSVVIKLIY